MYREADCQTEDADDHRSYSGGSGALEHCKKSSQRANRIKEERHTPRSKAAIKQTMMDMRTVRFENGFTAEEATRNRKSGIEQGDGHRHHGGSNTKCRDGLLRP